jgi:hypothetical protein
VDREVDQTSAILGPIPISSNRKQVSDDLDVDRFDIHRA